MHFQLLSFFPLFISSLHTVRLLCIYSRFLSFFSFFMWFLRMQELVNPFLTFARRFQRLPLSLSSFPVQVSYSCCFFADFLNSQEIVKYVALHFWFLGMQESQEVRNLMTLIAFVSSFLPSFPSSIPSSSAFLPYSYLSFLRSCLPPSVVTRTFSRTSRLITLMSLPSIFDSHKSLVSNLNFLTQFQSDSSPLDTQRH